MKIGDKGKKSVGEDINGFKWQQSLLNKWLDGVLFEEPLIKFFNKRD